MYTKKIENRILDIENKIKLLEDRVKATENKLSSILTIINLNVKKGNLKLR